MKKINALFLSLCTVFYMSCANFAGTNESVWGGGLWAVPTLTGLGAIIFGYKAWKDSKGPFYNEGGSLVEGKQKVPIYKIGFFYFFVALLIATALIITNIIAER